MINPHYNHPTIQEYYTHSKGWRFLGTYTNIEEVHKTDLYVNHEKHLTSFVHSNEAHTIGDYSTLDYDAVCPYNAEYLPNYDRMDWYTTESHNRFIVAVFIELAEDCHNNPLEYRGF